MRIIGCDLHARQQTLAMLNTTTGEVVKTTLKHAGNNVREFYCNLPRPVPNVWWVIRQRFERPNHENKNMIGEMRTYYSRCWWKSAFRRSGYLRKNW